MIKISRSLISVAAAIAVTATYPLAYAQSNAGGSQSYPSKDENKLKELTPGTSSGSSVSGSGASGSVTSSAASSDDKAIQNLLAAAQLLRESIQRMAQAPAGDKRTLAIREGNEALMQVQNAMAALPPNLLLANIGESDPKRALDKMKQASDRIYGSAQALAKQPTGKKTGEAINQINQAILETNQAMIASFKLASNSANSVMSGSSGSGSNTGAGESSSGSDSSTKTAGPTRANDIGIMDSPNSRELRNNAGASQGAGNTSSGNSGTTRGSTGSSVKNQEGADAVVGPTRANDIGVMDSPNSQSIRRGNAGEGGRESTGK